MKNHFIGERYGGGIIFWVDESGEHGLIVAPEDLSGSFTWDDAMQICSKYRISEHEDWRLPTIDEFFLLYQQRTIVGGFDDNGYWSSTEDGSDYAWHQYFHSGYRNGTAKGKAFKVRAIRAF